ncbi:MAG: hypothetical protein GYA17_21345 [Chloroflexi bacterium]|jgi:uncharacterized protein involved in exopolysaccharide biosynthesis|nr:hypothetical protein [Anaerolineaceae bacterium]NMB90916.1 hypothetical protein [Chloroflexota bacterium]
MNLEREFIPVELLERMLRSWWLVALCMIAGGGIGWGIHQAQPPVYETAAVISTSIDFGRTGLLSDVEQDNAIGVLGDLIGSTQTLQEVAAAAGQAGIPLDLAQLEVMTSLERQNYLYLLRVRSDDPQAAAEVANLWVEQAVRDLTTAYDHAVRADGLLRYMDALQSCLEHMAAAGPVEAQCSRTGLAEILADLDATGRQATAEKLAARGLHPAVTFSLAQTAGVPAQPVLYSRGQMVLAGALVGLLVSLVLVYIDFPRRAGN